MDFRFTPEQQALRQRMQAFAERALEPHEALQIHGGIGLLRGSVIERLSARQPLVYEGTSEVQQVIIAQGLLE